MSVSAPVAALPDAAVGRVRSDRTVELIDALITFIGRDGCTDDEFDAMALRLFEHQYAANIPLRRFCQQRGITPRRIKGWRDIPPVPITAFKETTLTAEPVESCERVFMTSGTTRAELRGRHHHPSLAVYDRSMTSNFARRFMGSRDDAGAATAASRRLAMAILFPDEAVLPNSSLAHYLSLAVAAFGAGDSRHFVGAAGIDVDGFRRWLQDACGRNEPCAVLGASYSFVNVIDTFAARGERFALPAGSRLLDTGGYKRQSRELAADEFYAAMSWAFGVPRERCINMYGMTELSTQFYDDGNGSVPSVKSGPHWIRSRSIDPLTGRGVSDGDRGVLVHCDLANFNSTVSILTEDVGRMVPTESHEHAFELLGRVEGAAAKGCSLAVEEFLGAIRG